jgi:hypothetical protein
MERGREEGGGKVQARYVVSEVEIGSGRVQRYR